MKHVIIRFLIVSFVWSGISVSIFAADDKRAGDLLSNPCANYLNEESYSSCLDKKNKYDSTKKFYAPVKKNITTECSCSQDALCKYFESDLCSGIESFTLPLLNITCQCPQAEQPPLTCASYFAKHKEYVIDECQESDEFSLPNKDSCSCDLCKLFESDRCGAGVKTFEIDSEHCQCPKEGSTSSQQINLSAAIGLGVGGFVVLMGIITAILKIRSFVVSRSLDNMKLTKLETLKFELLAEKAGSAILTDKVKLSEFIEKNRNSIAKVKLDVDRFTTWALLRGEAMKLKRGVEILGHMRSVGSAVFTLAGGVLKVPGIGNISLDDVTTVAKEANELFEKVFKVKAKDVKLIDLYEKFKKSAQKEMLTANEKTDLIRDVQDIIDLAKTSPVDDAAVDAVITQFEELKSSLEKIRVVTNETSSGRRIIADNVVDELQDLSTQGTAERGDTIQQAGQRQGGTTDLLPREGSSGADKTEPTNVQDEYGKGDEAGRSDRPSEITTDHSLRTEVRLVEPARG